jgi:hypothetical protein
MARIGAANSRNSGKGVLADDPPGHFNTATPRRGCRAGS